MMKFVMESAVGIKMQHFYSNPQITHKIRPVTAITGESTGLAIILVIRGT